MKKTLATLAIASLLSNMALPVYAINLKQDLPLEKLFVYGTNAGGYMMDKKKADEAAMKLVNYDVIWDALGYGEEVLLNGDPNAFPDLKNNIVLVKATLDAVANMATAVGEGNYDTAAYEALNLAVTKINHPVVSLAWEAVKLAYESHQAVVQTKMELEIETLYGIVNNDRRLVGVQDGNSPKLIQINSETVDYFYDKYLITNDSVRALVKTYVEKKLNQDFPDVSYGTSLWAAIIGYSEEVEREETLRQLEEFRNVSRGWIRALLTDLNKQVKVQWAQTRVRQEKARFDAFYAQFKTCYVSIDSLMSHYKALRAFETSGGKERYEKKLKELQEKSKQVVAGVSTSLSDRELDLKYSQIFSVDKEAQSYAASSYSFNEDALYNGFSSITKELTPYISKLGAEIEKRQKAKFEKETKEINISHLLKAPPDLSAEIKGLLSSYQSAASGVKEPPDLDISKLNNIPTARGQIQELKSYMEDFDEIYKAESDSLQRASEVRAKINAIKKEADKVKKELDKLIERKGDRKDKELDKAISRLWMQYNTLMGQYKTSSTALNDVLAQINSIKSYVGKLHGLAGSYISQILYAINDARKECYSAIQSVDFYYNRLQSYYYPQVNKANFEISIEHAIKSYDSYSTMGKMPDSAYGFNGVSHDIEKKIWSLSPQINSFMRGPVNGRPEARFSELYELDNLQKIWRKKKLPDANTLREVLTYTSEEIDNARESFNEKKKSGIVNAQASFSPPGIDAQTLSRYSERLNALNSFASNYRGSKSIIAKYESLKRKVAQDDENRSIDATYLREMKLQWDSWLSYAKNQLGILKTTDNKEYFSYSSKLYPYEHQGKTYARVYLNNVERLASKEDIKTISQTSEAKKYVDTLKKLQIYRFISSNMPKTKVMIDDAQNPVNIIATMETPNFFKGPKLILEDDVKQAQMVLDRTSIKSTSYKTNLKEASDLLGLQIDFPKKDTQKSNIYYVNLQSQTGSVKALSDNQISTYKGFELGAEYIKAYKALIKLVLDKRDSILDENKKKEDIKEGQKKIEEWSKKLSEILAKAKIQKDYNSLDEVYQSYLDLNGEYLSYDYLYYKSPVLEKRLALAQDSFDKLFAKFESNEKNQKQAIVSLYKTFKQAYEQKADYEIMGLISNSWESSDGTTLMDLEDNFRNMFSLYDAITYSISNLQVEKLADNKYKANYDVEIIGKNFEMGVERKEKSSVAEEIIVKNKKVFINRTLNGRFWYRQ